MSESASPQEYLEYIDQLDPYSHPYEILAARRSYFGAASGPQVVMPVAVGDRLALTEALQELMEGFWNPSAEHLRAELEAMDFSGHEDLRAHFDYLLSIWHTREVMQKARSEAEHELRDFLERYGKIVVAPMSFNVFEKQQFMVWLKTEMRQQYEAAIAGGVEAAFDPNRLRLSAQSMANNRKTLARLKQNLFTLRSRYPALMALEPEWLDGLQDLTAKDLKWQPRTDVFLFYLHCTIVFLFVSLPVLSILEGIFR